MAMNGWLSGKAARIIGSHAMISDALNSAGATLLADGPSDILVHIAAAPSAKPAHTMSHAQWRTVLDEGLDQRFFAAKDFANDCRARGAGGAVLFVGAPEQAFGADQAAAAGALGNLTKTLGVEWARDGIRVNAILTHSKTATLGNLAAYLLSDYAAYITGAVMGIDSDDG
jgi:NAD(P)-dependent dehydrogenase (short-subunit alcohol dehydrogenase family)